MARDRRVNGIGGTIVLAMLLAASAIPVPDDAAAQASPDPCTPVFLLTPRAIHDLRISGGGRLCGPPLSSPVIAGTGGPSGLRDGSAPPQTPGPGPGRTFLASLILPGSGQWLQGQHRGFVYLGLEVLGWAAFLEGRSAGFRNRRRYRDFAWEVARDQGMGERTDGNFRYYESLASFGSSGAWDADPGLPGIQPEEDPSTYNGSIWSLAEDLFLSEDDVTGPGPGGRAEMQRALEYYVEHGYPPGMSWDWSGDVAAMDRYRDLIHRSDRAFRRATIFLGILMTNHLLSAVDGFLSARVQVTSSDDASAVGAGSRHPVRPGRERWSVSVRLENLP